VAATPWLPAYEALDNGGLTGAIVPVSDSGASKCRTVVVRTEAADALMSQPVERLSLCSLTFNCKLCWTLLGCRGTPVLALSSLSRTLNGRLERLYGVHLREIGGARDRGLLNRLRRSASRAIPVVSSIVMTRTCWRQGQPAGSSSRTSRKSLDSNYKALYAYASACNAYTAMAASQYQGTIHFTTAHSAPHCPQKARRWVS
jgi:hypothetical protein